MSINIKDSEVAVDVQSKAVVVMMKNQGACDVAIMHHPEGYTVMRSIDPVSPTQQLHHVSVSHWQKAVAITTAMRFAQAVYPDVKGWEAMSNDLNSVIHIWEKA